MGRVTMVFARFPVGVAAFSIGGARMGACWIMDSYYQEYGDSPSPYAKVNSH